MISTKRKNYFKNKKRSFDEVLITKTSIYMAKIFKSEKNYDKFKFKFSGKFSGVSFWQTYQDVLQND